MRFLCKIPLIGGFLTPFFYPVNVEIYEKIGNTIIKKMDRAKRISKKGIEEFEIFGENQKIEPPKYENYMVNKAGKPLLMLLKAQSGEYRVFNPVSFETETNSIDPLTGVVTKNTTDGLKLKVTDKNVLLWHIIEHRRNWSKYFKPKWYELYAPYIALAITGVLMLVMTMTVSKNLIEMSSQLSGVANAVKQAAEQFRSAASQIAP